MKRSRLNEITIRGIGVIDSASLEIGQGLTVLTGETGSDCAQSCFGRKERCHPD